MFVSFKRAWVVSKSKCRCSFDGFILSFDSTGEQTTHTGSLSPSVSLRLEFLVSNACWHPLKVDHLNRHQWCLTRNFCSEKLQNDHLFQIVWLWQEIGRESCRGRVENA